MNQIKFVICSVKTGELVCEIIYPTWFITSKILRELSDFCGEKYYVSFYKKIRED